MNKLDLNQKQFSDLLNLSNNVFYPLIKFNNKKEILSILKKKRFDNKFFPIPIYFGLTKNIFNKIKYKKKLKLHYKTKYLMDIINIDFFSLNKNFFGKKIFGKNYNEHLYFKKFTKENYRFISFEFKNINFNNLKNKFFISPKSFKKKKKLYKIKNLACFHTRNAPHSAHEWIHRYLLKKYKHLLIQPLVGQYHKGEYKDDVIVKTNKAITKLYTFKKVFMIPFFSYPRYGGPREAALHALVRKNYGCTHFWVGRDHASYKDFYKKYESQKFCIKNEKKLKIKIVPGKEPYFCSNCKKVTNYCKTAGCSKSTIQKISGTQIRRLLKQKKIIPNYLMRKKISHLLSKKSLLN